MFGEDIPRDGVREAYQKAYPKVASFAVLLQSLVAQLCRDHGIKVQAVETRAKDLDSLLSKFDKHPDYRCLADAEDLCGVRIVAFYLSDVDVLAELLREEFEVLKEEQRGATSPDAFGYQSLHIIARMPRRRRALTEYRAYAEFRIEFQIRTVLQHAWGVISHSLDYKNATEVPTEVRRKLFRVAALLETGDELFGAFRQEVESLRSKYSAKVSTAQWHELPLDLDSVIASWSRLPIASVMSVGEGSGFLPLRDDNALDDPDFFSSIGNLVTLVAAAGARTIGDLAAIMNNVHEQRDLLSALYRASAERGFSPIANPCDIVALSLLLKDPNLRVLAAAPFRNEIEEALDEVLRPAT